MKKRFVSTLIIIMMLSVTFSLSYSSLSYAEPTEFHTSDSSKFMEDDSFANLNYGFYWVREGNIYERADSNVTDAYDKEKPTMIFIHGWQASSGYFKRETLAVYRSEWVDAGDSLSLADYWIDAGYNVLMYQWNQLCDEIMPWGADAKIWTLDAYYGMRWKRKDGSVTAKDDPTNPIKPLAVSFVEDYLNLLGDNAGQEIRMTGHSMGGMFAIAAMGILYEKHQRGEIEDKLLPTRLSLMDPYLGAPASPDINYDIYWKEENDSLKRIKAGEIRLVTKDYLKKFHSAGIAIDYYWGTATGEFGFINDELGERDFDISPYVVLIKYDASVITTDTGTAKIGSMHCAIRDFYLYSIAFPEIEDKSVPDSGNYIVTASTPSSVVYSNAGKYYATVTPNNTLSPTDDTFIMTKDDYATPIDYTGKISGFVFNDLNRNGLKDDGISGGFKDIKVSLYSTDNQLLSTAVTDEIGFYSMDSPGMGSYYIVFDKVKGGTFTVASSGNYLDIPSYTDKDGKSLIFTLISDSSDVVINSGQAARDYLSKKYIVLYFVAGIVLISTITLLVFSFGVKHNKKEEPQS